MRSENGIGQSRGVSEYCLGLFSRLNRNDHRLGQLVLVGDEASDIHRGAVIEQQGLIAGEANAAKLDVSCANHVLQADVVIEDQQAPDPFDGGDHGEVLSGGRDCHVFHARQLAIGGQRWWFGWSCLLLGLILRGQRHGGQCHGSQKRRGTSENPAHVLLSPREPKRRFDHLMPLFTDFPE
ncbi:MAG: hypothetical protein GWN87_03535, partial [Desulfuromonadales bacterium]|nr:hypothetical protein [Desulfuromonadales bacterium]